MIISEEAIKSIRDVVETMANPGVLGIVGHKIEKRCEIEIAAYFRSLAKVIEAANLESLATHEDKELAKHAAKMKIHNVVRKKHDLLRSILVRNSVDAYIASARMQHVKESEEFEEEYDPAEPRDDHGMWTDSAGATVSFKTQHGVDIKPSDTMFHGSPNHHDVLKADPVVFFTPNRAAALGHGKELHTIKMKDLAGHRIDLKLYHMDSNHIDNIHSSPRTVAKLRNKGYSGAISHDGQTLAWFSHVKPGSFKEAEGDDEPIDFVGPTAQDAADWAQANVADQMQGIDETTADILADDVAEGIEEQLGVDGTGRLIRQTLDGFTVSRAKTIASTEMNRSMSAAALKKLKAIEIPYKQLLPSPGACPICLSIVANGPVPIDDYFIDEDGESYDSSPIHPNCFVGETYVSTVSSSGVYKRWFEGEVVRILIEGQRELMLTVNHPILTEHGWVAAGLIKKGTNLIKCIDPMVMLTGSPHDYLVQSLFKEIFDSSLMSSKVPRMSVPGSAVDFHGDGIANQKIDIIPSKSFLEDERNASIIEKFSKLSFSAAHFGADNLPRIGNSLSMDIGLFLTPDSGMSFSGDSSSLSRFRHSEVHPFTPVSDRESKFFKRSDESTSIASDLPSEVIRCLADKISVVKVSDLIIVKEFSGHVYNLETKSGWYLAEGIVTHNCRCATTGARAPEVDDGN